MAAPARINYKIYQGSTFGEDLRWESDVKVYKAITGISNAAPAVITAVDNNIPVGWRFRITDVQGMTELNCLDADTHYYATTVTADTITINSVNSLAYTPYVSSGVVEYNLPIDLDGYTARMQIRSTVDSSAVIYEMTTENGDIVLDNITKTISLSIPAAVSAAFTFSSAVYSLELINTGHVTSLISGSMVLLKEVTR